jgi:adenylate kinase family enzyme
MLKKIVLTYGGPGSGKDTLAKHLSQNHNWGHASMSRALRQIDGAFAGLGIMDTIEQGGIVPLDLVMPAFQLKLAEFSRIPPTTGHLFFQGVLRSPEQVSKQVKLSLQYGRAVIIAKLDLDDDTMLSRILKRGEGRVDDDEHIARRRISEYRRSEAKIDQCVSACLKQFPEGNVLHKVVDASKPLQQVASALMHQTAHHA